MDQSSDISAKELARLRRARRGDRATQEARRLCAARLFEQGWANPRVAAELGATGRSVVRWRRAWKAGGAGALIAAPSSGTSRRLNAEQGERVRVALLRGPLASGYSTDIWPLARAAEVVLTQTGVSYHPNYMGFVLKQLGFSRQRPTTRAVGQFEPARQFFKQVLCREANRGL